MTRRWLWLVLAAHLTFGCYGLGRLVWHTNWVQDSIKTDAYFDRNYFVIDGGKPTGSASEYWGWGLATTLTLGMGIIADR